MIRTVLAALAALAGALANEPAVARGHRTAAPPADFTGLWTNASLTELERPDDFKGLTATEAEARAFEKAHRGKPPALGDPAVQVGGPESEWWELDVGLARIRGQVRTSWIVSPADGKRPFTPAAKAANKRRRDGMLTDLDGPESRDQDERCLGWGGAGPPLDNGGVNDNFQIVQAGDHLALYAEWMHDVRTVRLDPAAAHPPATLRIPDGDSIGHWEGATLVIETTNFTAAEVRAPDGDPKADMKVVERLTRLSPGELLYAFSVTSPARYTQTWQGEMLLRAAKGPIYEYACHEGNYGLFNMLAGARRLEGRKIDGAAAAR